MWDSVLGVGLAFGLAFVITLLYGPGTVVSQEMQMLGLAVLGAVSYVVVQNTDAISNVFIKDGSDVITEWSPAVAVGSLIGFMTFRMHVYTSLGHPFVPKGLTVGAVPASVMAIVGTFTVHEWYEKAREQPGGVSAWVSTLVLCFVTTYIAHRGQAAANGTANLGIPQIIAVAAVGAGYFMYVEEKLNGYIAAATAGGAAEQTGKKMKKAAQKGVKALADVNSDIVHAHLPIALAALLGLIVVARLSSGKGPVPSSLKTGGFPPAFLWVTGTFTANALYRQACKTDGVNFDDLLPLFGLSLVSGIASYVGVKLQEE